MCLAGSHGICELAAGSSSCGGCSCCQSGAGRQRTFHGCALPAGPVSWCCCGSDGMPSAIPGKPAGLQQVLKCLQAILLSLLLLTQVQLSEPSCWHVGLKRLAAAMQSLCAALPPGISCRAECRTMSAGSAHRCAGGEHGCRQAVKQPICRSCDLVPCSSDDILTGYPLRAGEATKTAASCGECLQSLTTCLWQAPYLEILCRLYWCRS